MLIKKQSLISTGTPLVFGGIVALVYFLPRVVLGKTFLEVANLLIDYLNVLIALLIGIAIVYFLWGVLKYVTAGSSSDKANEGKNVMIYGIIAIFVMVSVWGLVNILVDTFGLDNRTAPLPQFDPFNNNSSPNNGGSGGGGDIPFIEV